MSKKNLSNSEKMNIKQQLTLPWLIISIASIVSFMAFLIAMFFQFYTAVFFAIFLCVIASAVFLDGVHKKKQNYISFGAKVSETLNVSVDGKVIGNLYAAGSLLGGSNTLYEGCGGGTAIISAMAAADEILHK